MTDERLERLEQRFELFDQRFGDMEQRFNLFGMRVEKRISLLPFWLVVKSSAL